MPEDKTPRAPQRARKETFFERLMRRVLTGVGGTFDEALGAGKKDGDLPSTGDLSDRLKRLIDSAVQVQDDGRRFAPHYIRLRYSWGQSSEEFTQALELLRNELLVVTIDHINDNRYFTTAPVQLVAKQDILVNGFAISVGFDEADAANAEQVEVPAEIYAKLLPQEEKAIVEENREIAVSVAIKSPNGNARDVVLNFLPDGKHNLTVGRIKENNLYLEDVSVSKHHASLVLNENGVLRVADIGSTNGTFLNGERIAYGKAYDVSPQDTVNFGEVQVQFSWEMPKEPEPEIVEEQAIFDDEPGITSDSEVDDTAEVQIKFDSNERRVGDGEPKTFYGGSGEREPETVFSSNDKPENVSEATAGSANQPEENVKFEDSGTDFSGNSQGATDFTGTLDSSSSSDNSSSSADSSSSSSSPTD